MSFSSDIKKKLAEVSVSKNHCRFAEVAGIIFASSTFSLTGKGLSLSISTENMDVVKRLLSLLSKLYNVTPELTAVEQLPKKTLTYIISFSDTNTVRKIMLSIGLNLNSGIGVDDKIIKQLLQLNCCRKAFLRGAFLGSGSITDPQKSYHLEMVFGSKMFADVVSEIMSGFSLNEGIVERKDDYIVYIKGCDRIIEFFAHIGAHSAIFDLENIRILKDINNNINRAYNCESANIDRTISSAHEQIRCIKIIDEVIGISKLSEPLRVVAERRLSNPIASLSELAAIEPEISRSTINHRIRKIKEIAYSIQDKETK